MTGVQTCALPILIHNLWIIFYAWVYQPTCELRRMAVLYLSMWQSFHRILMYQSLADFGTLISSGSSPIWLPANNDRLTSSLWILLTRFSHRHNLKCETVRITTSFWRLQIYRRRYYSSTVLRKEWFTHPQASSHFTSCDTIHTHGSPWTFPTHILDFLSPGTCYCSCTELR